MFVFKFHSGTARREKGVVAKDNGKRRLDVQQNLTGRYNGQTAQQTRVAHLCSATSSAFCAGVIYSRARRVARNTFNTFLNRACLGKHDTCTTENGNNKENRHIQRGLFSTLCADIAIRCGRPN